MKHRIARDNSRLASLFAVVPASLIRLFLRAHKSQLMMVRGGGLRLDNIPRDARELCALATRIPEQFFPQLLVKLKSAAPDPLPNASDALEVLEIADELTNEDDDVEIRSARWSVLLSWLSEHRSEQIVTYVSGPRASDEALIDSQDAHPAVEEMSGIAVPISDIAESEPKSDDRVRPDPKFDPLASVNDENLSVIDDDTDDVVARWKENNPNFAEVVGVRRAGKWYSMTDRTTRLKLFPRLGDIYVGGMKSTPIEYGAWRVRRQQAVNEFRAVSETALVYRVVELAAQSAETERVRELIRQFGESAHLQRTLFRLADRLTFRIRSATRLALTDFSEPAEAWHSLTLLQAGEAHIFLSPLPQPDTTYDLSDLDVLARRMLQKADTVEGLPHFSKSQLGELTRWIKQGEDVSTVRRRADQVLSRLSDLVDQHELMELITQKLLNHPSVKPEIERRIAEKVEELSHQKTRVVAEPNSLEKQRDNLRKLVENEKARASEASGKVTKAVRRAVEKVLSEADEKLAESTLFAALLDRSKSLTTAPNNSTSSSDPEFEIETIPGSFGSSLYEVLVAAGLQRRMARAFSAVIKIAQECGLLVAFSGVGASFLAETVTRNLSEKRVTLIRVRPGISDPFSMTKALRDRDCDAICILCANCSDMEVYAAPLEALAWRRVLDREFPPGPVVIISVIESPLTLPIGKSISSLTLTLNVDWLVDDVDEGLERSTWGEQVADHLRDKRLLTSLGSKVIARLADALPADVEPDTLTQLKNSLLASIRSPAVPYIS